MSGVAGDAARARTRGWSLGVSWLDVKLGVRMLLRHPGLTLVSVFALSIGIPASLIPIHLLDSLGAPLPFPGAERVVGIRNRNTATRGVAVRALHDYHIWKDEVTTISTLAAARTDPYNVISDDGRAEPIRGSQMTASGFQALGVPPLMGRVLLEADEVPGAPDVMVISHQMWQARMGGDPDVLGKTLRIGTAPHEIVGVMPPGFLFPMHDLLWLPLRQQPTDYEMGMGPDVMIFGRLAEGATLESARAEMTTIAAGMAAAYPATHEHLVPQVLGYTSMAVGIDPSDRSEIYFIQLIALTLLLIVCGNVGTLILARTATRTGEIAVRTALGASRTRIVAQLFVEALVLAGVSTGLGLLLGDAFGKAFQRRAFVEAPFWFDLGVKPKMVLIALSVAVLCAVVAGVLPALKATGRHVQQSLQGARTGSALRFGGASTVLIVAEVALAVGFLTLGATASQRMFARASVRMVIDPGEYMMAMLRVPWTDHNAVENDLSVPEFRVQVAADHEAMRQRLAAEPGVRGVAMGTSLPGMNHPARRVEVEGEDPGEGFEGYRVQRALVDVGFFAGLGTTVVAGRDFTTADLVGTIDESRTAVIVNTAFVRNVLRGGSPIGRRFRYIVPEDRTPGPWYEIVGVVGHLGMNEADPARDDGVYHPAGPGEIHPIWMAIRTAGADPLGFTPRLRTLTGQVDAEAMIQYPFALEDPPNGDKQAVRTAMILFAFLAAVAVILSGAGLYALMSFTVSQRTREIGIRTALGARPGGVLLAIARRAFLQLLVGVAAGVGVGWWLRAQVVSADANVGPEAWAALWGSATFMLVVGMLACTGPALRGLRIEPVEALREG